MTSTFMTLLPTFKSRQVEKCHHYGLSMFYQCSNKVVVIGIVVYVIFETDKTTVKMKVRKT